jgi:AcrR family transcriptional regulator
MEPCIWLYRLAALKTLHKHSYSSNYAAHGFDRVTVDEIAEGANVGRMTVFNHFPRKEDMFFDRDEEIRETLRETLRQRDTNVSRIEAFRLLAYRLVAEQGPYVGFSVANQRFANTI